MSNIIDIFFFIGFIGLISLFFYKLYNIFSGFEMYDFRGVFLTFIGALIFWFFGLISFLSNPQETVFIALFRFSNLLLILNVMMFIVELLVNLGRIGADPYRQKRFSNREQRV